MADDEKHVAEPVAPEVAPVDSYAAAQNEFHDRPPRWIYKGYKIFGREIYYASPRVQLVLVALVCFLCPGMYNSLTGLGGGGQVDPTAQDHSSVALYSTFAAVGFFSGTFANRLGLRLTLGFGGLGYCIYSASFLSYNHNKNIGFVIFAGAFLGVCAGLLWTAQGAVMMSYPPEDKKGRYIATFWIIFNLGAVIGSLIPLAQNIHSHSGTVSDGTYAAFIVLMFLGLVLCFFLLDANKVIREDGTKIVLMKNPSWTSEFKGLWETLYNAPYVLLLFPMFFASNIFYTYQNNDMNAAAFNIRTRSLNNLLYWLAQIIGAVINGFALDYTGVSRSTRAKASFVFLFVLTFAIWGGGYAWQKMQPPRSVVSQPDYESKKIDWEDGGKLFIGPMFLYFFYGFYDAIWQTNIYWWMGSLSNSGRKTANMAGFYKSFQSVGAAIFWRLDGLGKPYITMFAATWGVLAGSLLLAAPVVFFKIKDHVSIEEDLKFSDETIEDVVVGANKQVDV
ncbi:major facilitator superfamily domain-containing protein [Trichoderma sp. SZMC 28013]